MAGFAKTANVPVWLGEGGPHNGGGGGEYASTFVSSFGYMDTLGTLASLNHSVFARQTLVGGNYELLRCSSGQITGPEPAAGCDFEPHPDYYVALLWRRLMGGTVLDAPMLTGTGLAAADQHVRLRAHCTEGATNGSLTIAFANTAESNCTNNPHHTLISSDPVMLSLRDCLCVTATTFKLVLPAAIGGASEYHLSAAKAGNYMYTSPFESRVLSLNGGPALRTGKCTDNGPPPQPDYVYMYTGAFF